MKKMKKWIKNLFVTPSDITVSNINCFIPRSVLKEMDSANRALEFANGGGFGNALLCA